MESTLFDKTFRDREGNLAIAHRPNLPILTWLGATLLTLTPVSGSWRVGLDVIAFGALFTWAWLELFQGVNYFRRALGLVVLVGVVVAKSAV